MTPRARGCGGLILLWTLAACGGDARAECCSEVARAAVRTPARALDRAAALAEPCLESPDLLRSLINERRAAGDVRCGEQPFARAPALARLRAVECAADRQSLGMALRGYFSHTAPDGSDVADRARRCGYPWPVGEAVSWGQQGAREAVDAWMASPPHCRVLMNPSFAVGGGACRHDGDGLAYWSFVLGTHSGSP